MDRYPTPNAETGRQGHAPYGIVVHTTAGTFSGTVAWFADSNSAVCSHYLVGVNGDIAQFVDEEDTARHAGRVRNPTSALFTVENPNLVTVGIEFEDGGDPEGSPRSALQYRNGADLIRGIASRWHFPVDRDHVVGHNEIFDAKLCPGNLDIGRLIAEASGD